MRFSTIAFTLFGAAASASASLVARQANPPNCFVQCVTDLDGCDQADTKCLCTSNKFVTDTTACVIATCKGDDLTNALAFSNNMCLKVGVTLTSTPAALSTLTAQSSAASGSSTVAGNSTATSSGTSASNTASAPPANTSAPSSALTNNANALFGIVAAGLVALAL
ncbi:hypothetical protein D9613_010846 [Agrocybe pediades]|uniref:CFEM domain-containing protein n=1 Tax=Agrocybe pediades TaxID=84607 RepID=A0A8H4QM17_9AGAR|nr:hypothetical protein D9613_010846 [Agrocybe pediades]KAF9551909.1 hypothetical protein CPC08DRAFT_714972 [Agrocybe pediades]